jgi:hypothetical protein
LAFAIIQAKKELAAPAQVADEFWRGENWKYSESFASNEFTPHAMPQTKLIDKGPSIDTP